jgi:Holliday junction resolvase RusA-like endonuclease
MPTYDITPIPKPRMTARDKWAKRKCVLRYFAFKDECREKGVNVESGDHITFHMPVRQSWSRKKQREMVGHPHLNRPDADNLLKAVLDAVYTEDSHIWDIHVTKLWATNGAIEVRPNGAEDE